MNCIVNIKQRPKLGLDDYSSVVPPTLSAALQFLFPSKPLMHSSWPSNIIQKNDLHAPLFIFWSISIKMSIVCKNVTAYSCCVIQAANSDVSVFLCVKAEPVQYCFISKHNIAGFKNPSIINNKIICRMHSVRL